MEEELKRELEKLVDVCTGKMTIKELNNEIINYMIKSPELMVVTIERVENEEGRENGYNSTIYLTEKDFYKKR